MPAEQQQHLQLQVTLDDQASAGLAKLREELSSLGASAQGVVNKFQSHNQDLGKEIKELAKESTRGFEGLTKYIGKFGAAGAAMAGTAATIAVGIGSLSEFAAKIQEISNKAKVIGMDPAELKHISEQYEKLGVGAGVVEESLGGMVRTLSELARPETGKLTEMVQAAGAYGPVMLDAIRKVEAQTTQSGQLNEILTQRQNVYDNVLHQQGGTREKAAQAASRFMQLWKLDPILGVTGAIDKFMAEKSKRFQDQQKATEKFRDTTFEIGKEWEKFTEDLSTSALSADGVIVHGLELANSILKEIHSGWNGIFDSPTAKYFTTVLSFLVSPLSAANQIYNKLHGDGAKQPAGGGQPTDVPRSTREEDLRHSPWLAGPSKNTGTAPLRFADLPATGGGEGEGQRSGGGAFKHFDEWLASKPASEHIEDRRNETRAAVADIKDDYLKDLNENTTQVKKLNEYFKLLDEGGEGRQGLGRLLGRGGMGIGGGGGGGGGGGPNGSSVGPGTGPGATQSTSPSSPTTTESKPTEPLASPSEAPAVRGAEGVQGLPGTQSGPAASRGGGYDPESGMTYPPTAGYGGGGGGGSATGVRGLPGSPSGPAVRRPTPDASAAPPQSPAAPGGGAAPRSVGPGGYSLADQKGHQYYEHGGVTLGGQTYHWGSGGGGAGAIEYGTYNINVATPYGGKGQLGPVGNRIGSVATLGGLGGTYKGSHDWEGVQIHRAFNDNLDKLYTAGCFSIKASEWPKFKQHLIEEGRKHPEGLQLTVGPNGMASITSRGSGQELVPSKARDAANDDRKQGPVHAASAAASVTPGGSKAGAPVGPKEGGVLPGDDPGSGGPGSHGGRFNAPTGARIAPGSQLETVTLSNGQKVTVNKKAAGQFKGFFNDLIAAGAPVRSLGGPGMRGNPSQHPNALAVDWAQHSRDVVDPDVRKWIDSHRDLMAGFEKRWGISGGENWGHKDTGHVSIDTLYGEEHLKQAQIASAGGEDRATVDAAAAPKSVRTIKVDAGGKLTANINAPANTSVKVEGSGGFKSTETNRTMPPGGGGAPKSTTTPSGPSKADLAAAAAAPG